MKRKSNATQKHDDDLTKVVGRALRRAGKRARETARRYGTPIYVTKDGKVVALKP